MRDDNKLDIVFTFVNDRTHAGDEPENVPDLLDEPDENYTRFIVITLIAGLTIGSMFAVGIARWWALYGGF